LHLLQTEPAPKEKKQLLDRLLKRFRCLSNPKLATWENQSSLHEFLETEKSFVFVVIECKTDFYQSAQLSGLEHLPIFLNFQVQLVHESKYVIKAWFTLLNHVHVEGSF
jgi:hypothetical protein